LSEALKESGRLVDVTLNRSDEANAPAPMRSSIR